MYAKKRSKKDEPLSNIGKRAVRVTGKSPSVTPTVFGTETMRTASPTTLIEEIPTPVSKKSCLSDKEKEKVDSLSSTVWDDEKLAVERARGVVTTEVLKVFLACPSTRLRLATSTNLFSVGGKSSYCC